MAQIKEIYNFNNPLYAPLRDKARGVVKAYQDANRWLDTAQEYIYIEQGMPNLARVIHLQAHVFPQAFDKFIDMLHERHLMGEYPTTEELDWQEELKDVNSVFAFVLRVLEHINEALEAFHEVTDNAAFRAMALKTEEFMLANSQDYTKFLELAARWENEGGSKTTFDNYCRQYLQD